MTTRPDLTQAEIDDLCAGLTLPAAQIRYLRETLHLHVQRKPNGRALLLRSELERVHGAARLQPAAAGTEHNGPGAAAAPNIVGLQAWARQRGSNASKGDPPHGPKAKRR